MRITYGSLTGLVLLLVPTFAGAQAPALDQGSLLVGGSASITSAGYDEGDDDRTTAVTFAPDLQYFVAPGLAVGGSLTLARNWDGDVTATTLAIGPAATWFWIQDGAAQPFVSAAVRFGSSTTEYDGVDVDSDASTTELEGSAGVLYLVSDAVGVNARLFYRARSLEFDDVETDSDVFGLAIGFSAFVF